MSAKRVLLSWSSGKDSSWTLYTLQHMDVEIVGLLTTFNGEADRVAMHAVRHELVEAQAKAAGLPLWSVPLPFPCSNEQYEKIMAGVIERAKAEGVTHMAFGDLFLEDIRDYRIKQLTDSGIEPLFPIWSSREATPALAHAMVDSGLKAVITCVDPKQCPSEFAGRIYDASFLEDLPESVDPCGENGEFHSFCFAGPHFQSEIPITVGETIFRDGFVFTDVTSGLDHAD